MAVNQVERKYTGSTVISIAANKWRVIKLQVPQRGLVHKLVVRQDSGTAVACVVDLFDTVTASGQSAEGEYADPYSPSNNPDIYRIIVQQSILSGATLRVTDSHGIVYQNFDSTGSEGRWAGMKEGIYLVIAPTSSAGTTTWQVAIATSENIG